MLGSEENLCAPGRGEGMPEAYVGGPPGLLAEMNGMKLQGWQISAQSPGPIHLLPGPAFLSPPPQLYQL